MMIRKSLPKSKRFQKKLEYKVSQSSPLTWNCCCLNGQQFNPDIPCFCSKVEHCTITVHRGTRVDNFYTVNIHDTTLIVDMSAADKIKGFHVSPYTLAAHMFTINLIEGLVRGGMGKEDVVNGFFHLFHSAM